MNLHVSRDSRTIATQVERRVRELTHNRVRNFRIDEEQGRLLLRGEVSSHHTRQLALQGALELLASDRFAVLVTVG